MLDDFVLGKVGQAKWQRREIKSTGEDRVEGRLWILRSMPAALIVIALGRDSSRTLHLHATGRWPASLQAEEDRKGHGNESSQRRE